MLLNLDPMPKLKAAATKTVNDRFNEIAAAELQREQAHFLKRILAAQIIDGGFVPSEFADEADLRNMTVLELARLIVNKPNDTAQRELARQTILLQIEAATTPADIDAAKAFLPPPLLTI